jgi:alpha-ketoglutarate-dependent taurine dioxygenase
MIPDFASLVDIEEWRISNLHKMVEYNPFDGRETLFLSQEMAEVFESEHSTTVSELIEYATKLSFYSHKWEEGDLLIWDNAQVMHKSSGIFTGKRLLYRIQSRMRYPEVQKSECMTEEYKAKIYLNEA